MENSVLEISTFVTVIQLIVKNRGGSDGAGPQENTKISSMETKQAEREKNQYVLPDPVALDLELSYTTPIAMVLCRAVTWCYTSLRPWPLYTNQLAGL